MSSLGSCSPGRSCCRTSAVAGHPWPGCWAPWRRLNASGPCQPETPATHSLVGPVHALPTALGKRTGTTCSLQCLGPRCEPWSTDYTMETQFHCYGCPWGSPVSQRKPRDRAIILCKHQNLLKSHRFQTGSPRPKGIFSPDRFFFFSF
ncbi:unnamed protein product [Gulo gulo]|uniref:Uncharacterized protein n=1 Tax=Gulo gulo TaxID=48420 RepID=A0A9X9PUJ6_GULGU|nr:unnamed protein product [Gulo gulo]